MTYPIRVRRREARRREHLDPPGARGRPCGDVVADLSWNCMVETGLGSIVLGIGILVGAVIVYRSRRA
jgi:hypothetical protein